MKKRNKIIIITAAVLAGILIGRVTVSTTTPHEEYSGEEKHVEYTCSMHPSVRTDRPGKCPICAMDLIVATTSQKAGVVVDDEDHATSFVRSEVVEKMMLEKSVSTYGEVVYSPKERVVQSAHIAGRVEKIYVGQTGEQIGKGAKIAKIYSPELAEHEASLVTAVTSNDERMIRLAKERLKNIPVSDKFIEKIAENKITDGLYTIYSDYSGVITNQKISKGKYIKKGEELFTINPASKIWLKVYFYPSDIAGVKKGSSVSAMVENRRVKATIEYVSKELDKKRQLYFAYAVLSADDNLTVGAYADVTVFSNSRVEGVMIPKSAVLWTGKRSIVYKKHEDGSFVMQEVILGETFDEYYRIKKGVKEGDEIVTKGAFSVDAAAQLSGKTSMMEHVQMMYETLELSRALKLSMSKFFENYLELKDNLVKSDITKTKGSVAKLIASYRKTDRLIRSEDEVNEIWLRYNELMKRHLDAMKNAKSLEKLRVEFKPLSNEVITIAKVYSSTNFFVQYCPMFDNNRGGFWLSDTTQIMNPYFGDAMLHCGEVRESTK